MKLKAFYSNSVAYYRSGKSIMLKSGPGRGKTTTIIACADHIGKVLGKRIGLSVISAPLLTPADTVGYLVPKHMPDGRTESHYTEPFWWRTEDGERLEEYDGGILFIDEADKADLDVKKILGEMALSGRCGPHKLPPGWVVWMAGNRSTDRSGSTKELDHLINRRFEIEVTDDLEGWKDWAIKNDVHYSLIGFAESNPQIVFPEGPPERQGPFCTPRSLVATGELLVTLAGNSGSLPMDDNAVEVAAGGIGQAAAAQLMATLKLDSELPPIETILASPEKARLPSAPDAQMLVCYKLAMLCDETTLDKFIAYVERLPADFALTFGKSIVARRPMLMAMPAGLAWQRRNTALLNMLTNLR
jgi:hypothetical protein